MGIICFCPHCGNKITITIERAGKVGGIISGAISGAIMGSNIGIAGGPLGAIAGTIPGFIMGAILGDNIGSKIDNPKCLNCNTSFKIPQKSIEDYKRKINITVEEKPLNRSHYLKAEQQFKYYYNFVKTDVKNLIINYTINEFDDNYIDEPTYLVYGLITINQDFGKNITRMTERFQQLNNTLGLQKDYLELLGKSNNDEDSDILGSYTVEVHRKIRSPQDNIIRAMIEIYGAELILAIIDYFTLVVYQLILIKIEVNKLRKEFDVNREILEKFIDFLDLDDLVQSQIELQEQQKLRPQDLSALKTRYDF